MSLQPSFRNLDLRKLCLLGVLLLGQAHMACAQTLPARPKKHGGSIPGTPLDTLMSTHLTTTVPEARDFVRETRPDPKTLDYAPMSSAEPDPERPKPRDAANIKALQAELEQDGARNAKRAHGMTKPPRHAKAVR